MAEQSAPQPMQRLSWEFLEEIANWTLGVGIVAALVGAILTHSPLFAAAVLAGVLTDVAIVYTTAHRAARDAAEGHLVPRLAWLFVGGRLLVKTIVLVAAFYAPAASTFWGAVIGVVLYDTVLLTAGSVRAASRMLETKGR